MKGIILIGPMGAGKSSIGRRIARLLDLPFHDTDEEVRKRAGVDIDFIFEKEGEAGFRRREERTLNELLNENTGIIATGGGVVISAANRSIMKSQGLVVFLETSVDWQLERTRRGTHRPLLDTADPRARLETLYAERLPLYRECATITISTDGKRVAAVANTVIAQLDSGGYLENRP